MMRPPARYSINDTHVLEIMGRSMNSGAGGMMTLGKRSGINGAKVVLASLFLVLAAWAATPTRAAGVAGSFEVRDDFGSYQNQGAGVQQIAHWNDVSTHAYSKADFTSCCTGSFVASSAQSTLGRLGGTVFSQEYIGYGGYGNMNDMAADLSWTDHLTVTHAGQLHFSLTLADTLTIAPGTAGDCHAMGLVRNSTFVRDSCAHAAAGLSLNYLEILHIEDTTSLVNQTAPDVSNYTLAVNAGDNFDVTGYMRLDASSCINGNALDYPRYSLANCFDGIHNPTPAASKATGDARFFINAMGGASYVSGGGGNYTSPGVPEPTTWAVMLTGLGLVGWGSRLSRRRLASASL